MSVKQHLFLLLFYQDDASYYYYCSQWWLYEFYRWHADLWGKQRCKRSNRPYRTSPLSDVQVWRRAPSHRFLIASTDDPGNHRDGLPVDRFEDPSLVALARQEMPHFIDLNLTDRRVDLRLGQSARSVPDPMVDCRRRNASDFRQLPKGSLTQSVDKNTEGSERMIGVHLSFIFFNEVKAAWGALISLLSSRKSVLYVIGDSTVRACDHLSIINTKLNITNNPF